MPCGQLRTDETHYSSVIALPTKQPASPPFLFYIPLGHGLFLASVTSAAELNLDPTPRLLPCPIAAPPFPIPPPVQPSSG